MLVVLVVVDCRSRVCAEVVVVWNDGGGTVNNRRQAEYYGYYSNDLRDERESVIPSIYLSQSIRVHEDGGAQKVKG